VMYSFLTKKNKRLKTNVMQKEFQQPPKQRETMRIEKEQRDR